MKPVLWPIVLLACAVTFGCGSLDRGSDPTPMATVDAPRLTRAQVKAMLISADKPCDESLEYKGHGIWQCKAFGLDETTGVAFLTPELLGVK